MIPVKGFPEPKTIEEAARRQLALLEHLQDRKSKGTQYLRYNFREASMHPDYHLAHAPELGMGMFSTDREGRPHDCEAAGMEWFADGKVLLCTRCWRDGT